MLSSSSVLYPFQQSDITVESGLMCNFICSNNILALMFGTATKKCHPLLWHKPRTLNRCGSTWLVFFLHFVNKFSFILTIHPAAARGVYAPVAHHDFGAFYFKLRVFFPKRQGFCLKMNRYIYIYMH